MQGFDVDLVGAVAEAVSIPVIASSGAGRPSHFSDVFAATAASAALALPASSTATKCPSQR